MKKLWLALLAPLALTGCPDDKRPLGGTCSGDEQCAEGMCIANICLDPDADEDGDGLTNGQEGALGTNPRSKDTDGDGIEDYIEVGGDPSNPIDSDGDGKPDVIESKTADADQDCISDQDDPDDVTPETDPAVLGNKLCSKVGACGADGAIVTATCPTDLVPVCNYGQVPEYEADETRCDGVDNDCDGVTDERYLAGGSVTFDGGTFAGDAGKALGATCGIGACAGGSVVCAVDRASLVCSTSGRVGPLTCGADNNCNGLDDLTEVADPLTTPLANCIDHFVDGDGDTYGAGEAKCLCAPAGEYTVSVGGDCDDGNDAYHPAAAPICGSDADCDGGLLDEGEACDDGNTDSSDGCAACQVMGIQIGGGNGGEGNARVVNLEGGGFAVSWSDGWDSETWLGDTLVFYDAAGREVSRLPGLGLESYEYQPAEIAALRGGGLVYLTWESNDGWLLRAYLYNEDGTSRGAPITVRDRSESTSSFGVVPTSDGAFAAWWYDYNSSIIALKHVRRDGQVDEETGGHAIDNGGVHGISAVGLATGEVIMSWTWWGTTGDPENPTYVTQQLVQRFDNNGKAVADAFQPIPESFEGYVSSTGIAPLGTNWALFFLEDRTLAEETWLSPLGYLPFDAADRPVGNLSFIWESAVEGCPYGVLGGHDEALNPYGFILDGDGCTDLIHAYIRVGATSTEVPFNGFPTGESTRLRDIDATHSGPLTVVAIFNNWEGGQQGVYLYRYAAGGVPTYIPGARRSPDR